MSLQQDALNVLKKKNVEALIEIVDMYAIPALEEAAKKSATPIDDMVVVALGGPLKDALKKVLAGI